MSELLEKLVREVVALRERVNALEVLESVGSGGWPVALDPLLYCAYDGPRPFETDYSGNPTGHMGQVAAVSGGVIYRPGRFGKGVQVAEATTNLLRNPSAEVDLTDWVFYNDGTSPVRERSMEAARIGSYGIRWQLGANTAKNPVAFQTMGTAPTQGQVYTGQVWVRAVGSAVGKAAHIYARETGGAQPIAETIHCFTLDGTWQCATVTHTVQQADRTNLQLAFRYLNSAAAGDEVYIDGWQLEQRAYATPYCDGSLGPGHSWTGTAHASTSTREAATLTYPSVSLPRSGTAMAWVNSAALVSANGNYRWILDHGYTNGLVLYINSQDYFGLYLGGVLQRTYLLTDGDFPPNTWHHVAMTWDEQAAETRLYLNGQQVGTTGGYAMPSDDGGGLDVGHAGGSYQWPGWIDEVVWCDRALPPNEVRAIYESNAPLQVGLWGPGFLGPTRTPASGTAYGQPGEIAWDGSYIYICTAPNTWRRAALSSF